MVEPLPPVWVRVATALLAVTIPLALLLTNVRLLLTPAYVELAYRMPAFPDDPFGLTREERIAQANVDLEYLLNDAGPEFLGDLRFADGTAVYNERELRHMVDVKRLVQAALRVWLASVVLAAGLGLLLSRAKGSGRVSLGLHWGSILTFALMVVIGLGILVGFSVVFVGFHRIFFQGDSWLFFYSDTLIRLFPERFWYDAFLLLAGSTLVEAAAVFLLTRRRAR
ncbi:MAG TPA: TIGR01906 family membrane protein [Anaerolineales bacterium]|nr:TIGR01906 family membrane protein [Anaerolineales bacterium]